MGVFKLKKRVCFLLGKWGWAACAFAFQRKYCRNWLFFFFKCWKTTNIPWEIPFLLSSVLSWRVAWWQCSGIAFSKRVQVRKLLFVGESHFHPSATNNNLQKRSLSVFNDLLYLLLPQKLSVDTNGIFPSAKNQLWLRGTGQGEESWVLEQRIWSPRLWIAPHLYFPFACTCITK